MKDNISDINKKKRKKTKSIVGRDLQITWQSLTLTRFSCSRSMSSRRFSSERIRWVHVEYKHERFLMARIHARVASLARSQLRTGQTNLSVSQLRSLLGHASLSPRRRVSSSFPSVWMWTWTISRGYCWCWCCWKWFSSFSSLAECRSGSMRSRDELSMADRHQEWNK